MTAQADARLEQWCWREPADPFRAPEVSSKLLCGIVYDHPGRPDGSQITTSPVVSFADGVATTTSGTRYRLGEPAPEFVAWMAEHYPGWDPARPLDVAMRRQ